MHVYALNNYDIICYNISFLKLVICQPPYTIILWFAVYHESGKFQSIAKGRGIAHQSVMWGGLGGGLSLF